MRRSGADLEAFAAVVRRLERKTPKVAMVSAATGEWLTAEQAIDPHYWAATLLAPDTAASPLRLSGPVAPRPAHRRAAGNRRCPGAAVEP